jgi:hypothetical protein
MASVNEKVTRFVTKSLLRIRVSPLTHSEIFFNHVLAALSSTRLYSDDSSQGDAKFIALAVQFFLNAF